MAYVVDNGGRYHFIDKECENVAVGDKYVFQDFGRWASRETYSEIKVVTRFTDLTMWLQGKSDEKEIRVSRSSGKPHGNRWGSRYAKRLTDKMKKQIKKAKAKATREANEKKAKANAEEIAKREKYGAAKITSEDVQEALRPIRDLAEAYCSKLEDIFDEIGGADAENPRPLTSYLEWNEDRASELSKFVRVRDAFVHLNDDLVGIVQRWNKGIAFKRSGSPGYIYDPANGEAELVRLLNDKIDNARVQNEANYFNGHRDDEEWRKQFIYDLRELREMRWSYDTISIVKDEEPEVTRKN